MRLGFGFGFGLALAFGLGLGLGLGGSGRVAFARARAGLGGLFPLGLGLACGWGPPFSSASEERVEVERMILLSLAIAAPEEPRHGAPLRQVRKPSSSSSVGVRRAHGARRLSHAARCRDAGPPLPTYERT